MSDLATLGIKIETTGAEQAKRGLDGVTQSSKNAEQATRSLAQAQAELVGTSKQETAAFVARMNAFKAETEQMLAAKRAAEALKAEQAALAAESAALTTGTTSLAASIAQFAIGGVVMAGTLAAVAALGYAWDKLTEHARKTREEHERLIKVLDELQKKKDQGPAGDIGEATAVRTKDLADQMARVRDLQQQLANLPAAKAGFDPFLADRARLQQKLDAARAEQTRLQDLVRTGNAETARLNKAARDQEAQQDAAALAQRLDFNQKDAAARKAAIATLAKDRAEYARLLTLPQTPDNSKEIARLAAEMKQLDAVLNPKVRAIRSTDARDIEEITRVLRAQEEQALRTAEARTKAVADAMAGTQQDLAESQLLLDAIRQGEGAYKAQQREIEILHALQREGLTISDDQYQAEYDRLAQLYAIRDAIDATTAAQRRAAEETRRAADEAQREQERRVHQAERTVSGAIQTILSGGSIGDAIKSAVIRGISDALAAKAIDKFGGLFGLESTGEKQRKAGQDMKQAGDQMVKAANTMKGLTSGNETASQYAALVQRAGQVVGAGVGGYAAGYGIGQATQNKAVGAIGGAVSGAVMGAQVGGPVGAAVGGIAGFIGGILGAGDAANAAAERLRKAKEAFDTAFEAAKAQVAHDDLGQQIAQIHAQYTQLREALKDGSTWLAQYVGEKLGVGTYAQQLAEINRLEQQRIAQLKEEAAAMQQYFREDLDVRILRAQGKTREADEQAFRNQQARERDEFRRTHQMVDDPTTTADDAQVAQNWADYNKLLYAQSLETRKNTEALNALTNTYHNMPTGYKIASRIYDYAVPKPPTFGVPSQPTWPQTPLGGGAQLPSKSISIAPVFQIDGTKSSRDQVKSIAVELRKIVTEALGKDADVSEGWSLLA